MATLVRIQILIFLLAPSALVWSQAIDFPNPPDGQVLDFGNWLGKERHNRLETELGRYRKDYRIDVMVVLWDRSLPPATGLEELADRLGQTWGRENMWIVVLHIPDSLHRPAVVAGGTDMDKLREEAISHALHTAVTRGMKERTSRAQVEALGLEAGEEFIFLQHRSVLEHKAFLAELDQEARDSEARHQAMIVRAFIVTLLALVAVGTVAVLYLLKRRARNLLFPETRWRRRLGAKWSGGGHMVVSLPPSTRAS